MNYVTKLRNNMTKILAVKEFTFFIFKAIKLV